MKQTSIFAVSIAALIALTSCQTSTTESSSATSRMAASSPFLSGSFRPSDVRQAMAIAELLDPGSGQSGAFSTREAQVLSAGLGRSISQSSPLTLGELHRLEETAVPRASAWRVASASSLGKRSYSIERRIRGLEGSICGSGNYAVRNDNGRPRTFGNEGLLSHAWPIGDVDRDGNDDILVGFMRGQWRQLDADSKDRYSTRPMVLTWSGGGYTVNRGLTAGLTDTVLPRRVEHADFNNDGYEDFFVADAGYDGLPECGYVNSMYRNVGGQRFERVTLPSEFNDYSHSMKLGDFDGDGDVDVAVVNSPHARSEKKAQCQKIYGKPTSTRSYFLINQGNFQFEMKNMPFGDSTLYYSALGVSARNGSPGYLILGEAGSDWRRGAKPKVVVNRVSSGFGLSRVATISPPSDTPSDLFAAELELGDFTGDGTLELVIGWQFLTPALAAMDRFMPHGAQIDFGGQYLQIIDDPFSRPTDITERMLAQPTGLNVRGPGAWCVELYAGDFNRDGTTDLACSSYDQWRRVNGRIRPHGEEVPVLYLNNGRQLVGHFLPGGLNRNKWLIPVNHRGRTRMAQLEPFTCDGTYSETFELR